MFQPRKNDRRPGRKRAGSSRRLRVEGMERRLMLSATTPELSPQVSGISPLYLDQPYLFAAPAIKDYSAADGGWIEFSLTDFDRDGQYANANGTFTSYPELGPSVLISHGTSVAGIIGADTNLVGVSDLGDTAAKTWTDDSTGTLPPPNYTSRFNVASIDPSVTPAPLQVSQTSPSSNEGGSISISNVLAELKQLPAAAGEKPSSAHVSDTATESQHTAHGPASPANLIPGEWGRASMFEMVNGAHSTDDHSALNFERAKLRADQSRSDVALPFLLNGESLERPDAETAHGKAHQSRDEGQSPGSNQTSAAALDSEASTIDDVSIVGAESRLGESHQGRSLSSAAVASKETNLSTALESHGAGSSAVALAMDELGSSARAADSWTRSRVTAAVVLVLALERVTAFNSREKNRRSSDAEEQSSSRRKPIRPRTPTALQLGAR